LQWLNEAQADAGDTRKDVRRISTQYDNKAADSPRNQA
jgi:hypothetical protein